VLTLRAGRARPAAPLELFDDDCLLTLRRAGSVDHPSQPAVGDRGVVRAA